MNQSPSIQSEVSIYCSKRLPKIKQTGFGEWRGPCPVHDGRNDSFAIDPHTGHAYCHSKCSHGWDLIQLERELSGGDFKDAKAEVFRLIGRSEPAWHGRKRTSARPAPSKATKPAEPSRNWTEIATYPYMDAAGDLLFEVVRYIKPDGSKAFVQRRPSGCDAAGTTDGAASDSVPTGAVVYGVNAGAYSRDEKSERITGKPTFRRANGSGDAQYQFRECPRVPYRLPKVLEADTVFLVEGEKDVQTLEGWSLTASCNPGGAGNTQLYRDWTEHFRGRDIVIIPDNDDPGRRHAADVAATLLPVAATVRYRASRHRSRGRHHELAGCGRYVGTVASTRRRLAGITSVDA